MSLDEKNGGPYTKQEQEIRKQQVFELHFEQGLHTHIDLSIASLIVKIETARKYMNL